MSYLPLVVHWIPDAAIQDFSYVSRITKTDRYFNHARRIGIRSREAEYWRFGGAGQHSPDELLVWASNTAALAV
jgi:3-methyladenine DNA glycosylase Mpg